MAFDAGTAPDPMDWDFTSWGGGKGTIPEPSEKAITTYYKDLRKAVSEFQGVQEAGSKDNLSQKEIDELMKAMEDIDIAKINGEVKKAVAKLCQNQPSITELNRLPYRVLNAFVQWLQGELSPEAKSAGTTQLRAV